MSPDLDGVPGQPQRFDEAEGVKPATSPNGRPGFLSDVIIELGLAERQTVDDAVEEARLVGQMPEQLLVERGTITAEQLAIAIAERNGLPYVDLFQFRVDDGAAGLIDSDTARRYRAMPIAFDADGALVVALPDPMDALAVSDIGVITKSEVRTAVASDPGIDAVLGTLPETKRRARLSAHGPDGFAGARASESGAWTIARSISTPDPAPLPDPIVEPPAPARPLPTAVQAAAPAADQTPDLEGRIDALVAAALDKRLEAVAAAPPAGASGSEEIEHAHAEVQAARAEAESAREQAVQAGAELAHAHEQLAAASAEAVRAREDAEQARAEVAALSVRIEQLEGPQRSQQLTDPQPPVEPQASPTDPQPPTGPTADESRFGEHLERVLRELGTEPGPA